MREVRRLGTKKQNRTQIGSGTPSGAIGEDGDFRLHTTSNGIKLYAKYSGQWYGFTPDNSPISGAYRKKSQSENGYETLSSGLIIQWGQTVAPANSDSSNVDFLLAFPSNVFVLVGSKSNGHPGASDGNDAGIEYVSLTQFKVYSDDSQQTVNWIAIGN